MWKYTLRKHLMRYKQSRKVDAHDRILRAAGRMILEQGPEKISVDALMREAGLTHGGFYAHFKSRDAMIAETLQIIFDQAVQKYHLLGDGLAPREGLLALINWYLSREHRDGHSHCPVLALSSDLKRQSPRFRAAYKAGLDRLVGIIAGWMSGAKVGNPKPMAASLLSAMAGSIAISRAVQDRPLSDGILETTRQSLLTSLGFPKGGELRQKQRIPKVSF